MVSKTQRKKILNKLEAWASQLKPKEIIDILPMAFCAYAGFKAVPNEVMVEEESEPGAGGVGGIVKTPLSIKLGAAGFGMVSYKLARSRNIIAGAAGVVGLTGIGIMNIVQSDMTTSPSSDYQASIDWLKRWLEIWGLAPKT